MERKVMSKTMMAVVLGAGVALGAGCGEFDAERFDGAGCPGCDEEPVVEREAVGGGEDWSVEDVGQADSDAPFCLPKPAAVGSGAGDVEKEYDEQGRLVRLEQRALSGDREFEWEYDEEGRLREVVTDVEGDPSARSVWAYLGDRPASVHRYVGDVLVERQSWEYDGERLAARSVEFAPSGPDGERVGESARHIMQTVDRHDSYSAQAMGRLLHGTGTSDDFDPWVDANAHLTPRGEEDCRRLPVSPGHGYPDDEQSYMLGWVDAGDSSVSTLQYDAEFPYFYGTKTWYGHLGVATGWPEQFFYFDGLMRLESSLEYDEEGRMVDERLVVDGLDDEKPLEVERSRQFDDRGLAVDRVVVERGDESGDAELRFDRSAEGLPMVRERFRNGRLVAFQNWSYDDEGSAEQLEVHVESFEHHPAEYLQPAPPLAALLLESVESGPEHVATLER